MTNTMMDQAAILAELVDYLNEHGVDPEGPLPVLINDRTVRGVFEGALWALSMSDGTPVDELRSRVIRLRSGPSIPMPGGRLPRGLIVTAPDPYTGESVHEHDQFTDPDREIYTTDGIGGELIVTRHADVNTAPTPGRSTPPRPTGAAPADSDLNRPFTDDEAAELDALPDDPTVEAQIAAARAQTDGMRR